MFAAFNTLEHRQKQLRNAYYKITPNLLFEYQCTSGKFIRLPNRIEKIDSVARIESNRNFFAGIGMLYRVAFKLIVTVHRCLNGRAPNYLSNHVIPVSAIVSRQRLRSAQQNTLVVPRYRLTTYGRRAFSVAGPTAWNNLPVAFRDRQSAMPASDGI